MDDRTVRSPMEEALCAAIRNEFAQLGVRLEVQLRKDVREELRSASKNATASPVSGPPLPGHEAGKSTAPTPGYQPHEWTKHHFRRYHTKQYINEIEETDGGIAHRSRSFQGALGSLPHDKVVVAKRVAPCAYRDQHAPAGAVAGGAGGDAAARGAVPHAGHPALQTGLRSELTKPGEVAPPDGQKRHIDAWASRKEGSRSSGSMGLRQGPSSASVASSTNSGNKRFRSLRNDSATGMARNAIDLMGVNEDSVAYGSRPRNLASKVVHSPMFEHGVILLIVANSITIGCQINHMATNLLARPPVGFRVADTLFCLCFIFELVLRLYVHRCRFFSMWGWGWNLMDLALVVANVAEEILLMFLSLPTSFVLRTIRVFRSVRVVRVLRVMRYAEDLRLLVTCILCSVRSFIWAVLLLFLTIYGFGAYLTQSVHIHRIETIDEPDAGSEELAKWYGSIPLTLLSLFQALTGGVDWNDIVRPLMDNMHPGWGLMAVMWIAFSVLAVLNIITGTFVQSAIERSQSIKDMDKVTLAHKIFSLLDGNSNGLISKDELVEHLDTEPVQDFFRTIDVDTSEAICLFELLDCSGDGRIDFEEFLSGIVRLQGNAKALDMIMLILDTKQGFQQQSTMLSQIYEKLVASEMSEKIA